MTRDNAILHTPEISSLAEALSKVDRVLRKQDMSFEAVSQNIANLITALNRTGDEEMMPPKNEGMGMRMPAWIFDDWDCDVIVSDIGTKEFGSESLNEEPETHVSLDDVLRMRGV